MGDFDFGAGGYFDTGYSSLGTGYFNVNYDDQTSLFASQDLYHGYIDTRPPGALVVEIYGVASSSVPPPPPTPPINATTDIIGGFASFASNGLTALYNQASTLPGNLVHAVGPAEQQVISHTLNLPSITASVVNLSQVVGSFVHNDARGVYTNGIGALAGIGTTEGIILVTEAVVGFAGVTLSAPALGVVAGIAAGAGVIPVGHFKFPHPWPVQTPPGRTCGL